MKWFSWMRRKDNRRIRPSRQQQPRQLSVFRPPSYNHSASYRKTVGEERLVWRNMEAKPTSLLEAPLVCPLHLCSFIAPCLDRDAHASLLNKAQTHAGFSSDPPAHGFSPYNTNS